MFILLHSSSWCRVRFCSRPRPCPCDPQDNGSSMNVSPLAWSPANMLPALIPFCPLSVYVLAHRVSAVDFLLCYAPGFHSRLWVLGTSASSQLTLAMHVFPMFQCSHQHSATLILTLLRSDFPMPTSHYAHDCTSYRARRYHPAPHASTGLLHLVSGSLLLRSNAMLLPHYTHRLHTRHSPDLCLCLAYQLYWLCLCCRLALRPVVFVA